MLQQLSGCENYFHIQKITVCANTLIYGNKYTRLISIRIKNKSVKCAIFKKKKKNSQWNISHIYEK